MPTRIPQVHRKSLVQLSELVRDDVGAGLVELLESMPAFTPTPELQAGIMALWPGLAQDEASRLTLAMLSIATQRVRWNADDLGTMISESSDLDIPAEVREGFGAVLATLVDVPVLRTAAKAVSVLNQQERLFLDARIMSDIRPIFGEDPSEQPTGAVVVHTLSIEHHTDGHMKIFNVAMDRNDLAELKVTVDRAITKAGTLSDVVEAAGLALFELEEAEPE